MSDFRAMIAMSGGIDSSVAAYLTQSAGYTCAGAMMRLYSDSADSEKIISDNAADARSIAQRLGIPFYLFDCAEAFQEKVIQNFIHCYEQGLTPNPCIECNRHLKFDLFLQHACQMGYNYIVTGHYAKISHDPVSKRFLLQKAVDEGKDQTYFLYTLTQYQLAHTLFPLGDLTKIQAREIAQQQGFLNARKRDSQDICFVPDGDYKAFLENYMQKQYPSGNYLDLNGNVVGKHCGAIGYTIGQRKGLGIAMGAPVYVCSKDMDHNTVTVGPNEALFHKSLIASDVNWIAIDQLHAPMQVCAKVRSRMTEQPATLYPEIDGRVRVEFHEPQRAISPGQAVVFYNGITVVGGGTIREVL